MQKRYYQKCDEMMNMISTNGMERDTNTSNSEHAFHIVRLNQQKIQTSHCILKVLSNIRSGSFYYITKKLYIHKKKCGTVCIDLIEEIIFQEWRKKHIDDNYQGHVLVKKDVI